MGCAGFNVNKAWCCDDASDEVSLSFSLSPSLPSSSLSLSPSFAPVFLSLSLHPRSLPPLSLSLSLCLYFSEGRSLCVWPLWKARAAIPCQGCGVLLSHNVFLSWACELFPLSFGPTLLSSGYIQHQKDRHTLNLAMRIFPLDCYIFPRVSSKN